MVFISFESFILAHLLVSLALQTLYVHGVHHQVHVSLLERILSEGYTIKETQENDASIVKEVAKMGMILMEDGQMASRSSTRKLKVKEDKKASKEGPQELLNNQVTHHLYHPNNGQENTLEKMAISPCQSSRKQGFSRSIVSPSSFNTNKIVYHDDRYNERRKLLVEADKKFMQMMRRDYGGLKRPRRRTPINNHEPRN